jgi:hypothetical protein
LFDRAAARDFVDVFMLSEHFSKTELLERAAEVDAGFARDVFADMIDNIRRYRDTDLALGGANVKLLRAFFSAWLTELRSP